MKKHIKGFTLIEILIVILIISIISSVALLTISSNHTKQLENIANMIKRKIILAEQEAMLRPSTIGLGLNKENYKFFNLSDNTDKPWKKIISHGLNSNKFPSYATLNLKINNRETSLDGKPHIIISTSGEITPFTITFAKENNRPSYIITGKSNGSITVQALTEK
ncbi:type II secretion system minor pseudopilin GspH [Gammaproteobacteria bacterium]|nr:type II secretion system minor pseudopilin GspH [Gammaproteobacteria bacterium]